MKYQLLLLTIYLITIAYSQDNVCSYTTSETCKADTNCEWEEANPGKCEQETTNDCSKLANDEEHCKGGCTLSTGTCANTRTNDACATAGSTSSFDSAKCTAAPGCVVDGNACKAETNVCDSLNTQTACTEKADSNKCGWTLTRGTCANIMTDETCAEAGKKEGSYDEATCTAAPGCVVVSDTCKAETNVCDSLNTQSACEEKADSNKCGWTGTCENTMTDDTCATAGSTSSFDSAKCTAAQGCVVDGNACKAETNVCDSLNTQSACEEKADSNKCGWTPGSCTNSCTPLNEATCGSTTGCSWKGKTNGSCKKIEDEKKEEGSGTGTGTNSGSDSDSSNYVKIGNYLLVLFLFLF